MAKPKSPDSVVAFMSDVGIDRLHELVGDPIRRKILIELHQSNRLGIDELAKKLGVDSEEIAMQLYVLSDLVVKTNEEFTLTEQGVEKHLGGQYMLNEKGHDAVNEMIAFPEIKSEHYKQLVDEKYFSDSARNRRKITFTIAGAFAGYIASFLGGLLIIAMLSWSTRISAGQYFFSGTFWFVVLAVAPIIGGYLGYSIGKQKGFERPAPEWSN